MKTDNREIEVKFEIGSAADFSEKILEAGAECVQPVQFERNLRFDDSNRTLFENREVLRLRDNGGKAILTYKADLSQSTKLADREEIETVVADFDQTKLILERLGYSVFFIYEKYRSVYSLRDTFIFADHTPIGDYVEIEGPDEGAIQKTAEVLGLDWETRIGKGYRALFIKWKTETGFAGRDMTFSDPY